MVCGKNRTGTTKLFLRLLLAALLLAAIAPAAHAATHTITKATGTPIALPVGLAAGDTIVVTGDRLEPPASTTSTFNPGGDWTVLRGCLVPFALVLERETTIRDFAFRECDNLTSVSLPAATSIGYGAFYYCISMTSVSLPAATTIGSYAFHGCTALTSISLPAATNIGDEAFPNTALASVSLPAATNIGSYAFYNCAELTSVSLPAATTIGSFAFDNCDALTSISLPAATDIGNCAFDSCTALTSVSLPAATNIGNYAFDSCTALTSVSLPAVTTIGGSAFKNCAVLRCAVLPAEEPPNWSSTGFPAAALLIVPDSANWPGRTTLELADDANYAAASKPYVVSAASGKVTLDSGLLNNSYITNIEWYRDGVRISDAGPSIDADRSGVYQMSFKYQNGDTRRLPAWRVVIGTVPAFADGVEAGDKFSDGTTGYALNRTFKIAGGSQPITFDVVNSLPSDVAVTKTADAVTLAGLLPSSMTAVYPFVLTATNDFAFWAPGAKPATLVYRAAVSPAIRVSTSSMAAILSGSPQFAGSVSVSFSTVISSGARSIIQLAGFASVHVITAVSPNATEVKETPINLLGGTVPFAMSFSAAIQADSDSATPITAAAGDTAARTADDAYILPVSLTLLHNGLSSDLPGNWTTMTDAERAAWLTDDGSGNATVFAYEYVPKSGDAAQPPVHLIGPGGMLSWSDAIDADIVAVDASGDLTVNYIALTGTGEPFVAESWLVIPDGEPYPGYLTDPAWLLRVPASSNTGSSGVGCGMGAGVLGLLALIVLRRRGDQ